MKTATTRTKESSVETQHSVVPAVLKRASWLPKRQELQFATPGVQTASRGADVIACISETEDDLELGERLIKRNSSLRSNLCSRARVVAAKGTKPADSRLQNCGQLQRGADIVTCIVGNGDCLQADLELISRLSITCELCRRRRSATASRAGATGLRLTAGATTAKGRSAFEHVGWMVTFTGHSREDRCSNRDPQHTLRKGDLKTLTTPATTTRAAWTDVNSFKLYFGITRSIQSLMNIP